MHHIYHIIGGSTVGILYHLPFLQMLVSQCSVLPKDGTSFYY